LMRHQHFYGLLVNPAQNSARHTGKVKNELHRLY
jgi:hypothetical protein